MDYSAERIDHNLVPPGGAMNTYPTFLHMEGLEPLDTYTTPHGFTLPAEKTSYMEFGALIRMVSGHEIPLSESGLLLPSVQQLSRITIAKTTGCWQLPVYMNGEDVYPEDHRLAGKPRARYGKLSVRTIEEDAAHRTMFTVFRGPVPRDKYLDHVCNNKACCWHRHIDPVLPAENTSRGREYLRVTAGQLILFNRELKRV